MYFFISLRALFDNLSLPQHHYVRYNTFSHLCYCFSDKVGLSFCASLKVKTSKPKRQNKIEEYEKR